MHLAPEIEAKIMPINEARITASCDWCDETTDEMDLTPLAGGGWDARNIPRKLDRLGWQVDGDKVFCSGECFEKHVARAVATVS